MLKRTTKSIILSMLFVIGAMASVSASTMEEPGMAVIHAQGSKVVKVVYKGTHYGRVKVNLYDATSTVVFSETFANIESFILPLNFSGMKEGEYTVELIDAEGPRHQKIQYDPASSTKYIRVNKIEEGGEKFLLSVVGTQPDDKIRVKIYNGDVLIYNEAKDVKGDFAEVYSVRSALGPLTFRITDKDGKTTTASFKE